MFNTKDQSNAIVYCVWYLICRHCRYEDQSTQCIECYVCRDCRYTGVCGSFTTPYTEYYEVWKLYSTLYKVASHLNIQPIFNLQKGFWKLRLRAFQPYHQYYICRYCQYRTRISNAFNAIYVDTVDTKHIHMFLPITFLIFNLFSIRKKFWKAENEGFSTIPLILYMSILSIQDKDL